MPLNTVHDPFSLKRIQATCDHGIQDLRVTPREILQANLLHRSSKHVFWLEVVGSRKEH